MNSMIAVRRAAGLLMCAACIACANHTTQNAQSTSPARVSSRPFDLVFIFARDSEKREDVQLNMERKGGKTTIVLLREARPGRPRILLDSIGPGEKEPEEVTKILNSFDLWALNAPNAPGAACKTTDGRRKCVVAAKDYSLVMQVERDGEVRVQRYTGLEQSTSNQSARAIGDIVLAWARTREASVTR